MFRFVQDEWCVSKDVEYVFDRLMVIDLMVNCIVFVVVKIGRFYWYVLIYGMKG